jgi:hypothetical protein
LLLLLLCQTDQLPILLLLLLCQTDQVPCLLLLLLLLLCHADQFASCAMYPAAPGRVWRESTNQLPLLLLLLLLLFHADQQWPAG